VKTASGRIEDGKFGLFAWSFFPIGQSPAKRSGGIQVCAEARDKK
jgi:hypothetical protein